MQPTQITKEITVVKIDDKKSKKGVDYLLVTDQDNKTYYAWEAVHFSMLRGVKNSGEKIKVVIEEGKYPTIKGIDGVEIPVAKSGGTFGGRGNGAAITANMERKETSINKNIERKENSIVEAAIRRDAVIFTSICNDTFGGEKRTDEVKKAHEYWLAYFREMYLGV